MTRTVAGKVAVVTGAGSGIGAALVSALRERGLHVVAADIDESAVRGVADGDRIVAVQCDVAKRSDVQQLAATTLEIFGGVDYVFNNAGVGSIGEIRSMTADDWRWMLDVNLMGVVHGVEAFLPILDVRPDGGHIINTASMSAVAPLASMGAYAVAKSGVLALSEVLADELRIAGSPVSVSVALPGPVRTNIGTSQRTRPTPRSTGLSDVELGADSERRAITAAVAAERILRGADRRDLYIFTHPALRFRVEERSQRVLAGFDATR